MRLAARSARCPRCTLAELQRRSGALCGSPTTFAAPFARVDDAANDDPRINAAFGAERLPGIDVRAAAAAPIPGVAVDGECAGAIELINFVGAELDDLALNDLVAACAMLPELLMLGAS